MQPFPFFDILEWYQKNGRHSLPWRTNQTPYSVWISEIFLQQTQVTRGEQYFLKIMAHFPTLEDFSKLSYEEFFSYYEGLGYYSRARNMIKTAQIVVEKYDGVFPSTFRELVELPGVGPYTAQAILAFGYGEDVLAFDVNMKKIFSRFYAGSRFIPLSKSQEEDIQAMFVQTNISGRDMNAALMDFASLVDKNDKKYIDWEYYPLKSSQFFLERGAGEIRISSPKTIYQSHSAHILVFLHENHKMYFSLHPDIFQPFQLSPTSGDHRHAIKKYFLEHFGLAVSVRPPFLKKKCDEETYFCYHAQIQTGNQSDFGEFGKEQYAEFLSDFFK